MEEKNLKPGVYIEKAPVHQNCRCSINPDPGPLAKIFDEMAKSICIHDFTPSRIVKSGPCTIVFWKDGTKTLVRCPADTVPNDYEAFTAALAIKIFGTNSQVKKLIQRLTVIQPPKEKKKKGELVEDEPGLFEKSSVWEMTLKPVDGETE